MAHLIDKDALVAEIESLTDNSKYCDAYECGFRDGNNSAIDTLKGKLNTLEVKEVDLESEMDSYFETMEVQEHENIFEDTFQRIAKHFFELGLKTKQV